MVSLYIIVIAKLVALQGVVSPTSSIKAHGVVRQRWQGFWGLYPSSDKASLKGLIGPTKDGVW